MQFFCTFSLSLSFHDRDQSMSASVCQCSFLPWTPIWHFLNPTSAIAFFTASFIISIEQYSTSSTFTFALYFFLNFPLRLSWTIIMYIGFFLEFYFRCYYSSLVFKFSLIVASSSTFLLHFEIFNLVKSSFHLVQ